MKKKNKWKKELSIHFHWLPTTNEIIWRAFRFSRIDFLLCILLYTLNMLYFLFRFHSQLIFYFHHFHFFWFSTSFLLLLLLIHIPKMFESEFSVDWKPTDFSTLTHPFKVLFFFVYISCIIADDICWTFLLYRNQFNRDLKETCGRIYFVIIKTHTCSWNLSDECQSKIIKKIQ